MIWIILGILYFIIGIAITIDNWTRKMDLDLQDIPIILTGSVVWPIVLLETIFILIGKITLIKRRCNDSVRQD